MQSRGGVQGDGRIDATYNHARENTPGFDPSRVIVPFTHDWGPCLAFEWCVLLICVVSATTFLADGEPRFILLQERLEASSKRRTTRESFSTTVDRMDRDGGP